jgi:hypothetical protein
MALMTEHQKLDAKEIASRRRRRNIALALALATFAIIFYVLTLAKLGTGIFDRAL